MYQTSGVWYISGKRFSDGMVIHADGTMDGYIDDNPKADKKLKKRVKNYAKLYADNLPLDMPGTGDCWFCSMVTTKGDTLGDAVKDTDHLMSHIEEGYVVPSLAWNALIDAGYQPDRNIQFSLIFSDAGRMKDYASETITKVVYRYIVKRLGYAI
jgi:hypothetical protein